jgi:hypothetical protein
MKIKKLHEALSSTTSSIPDFMSDIEKIIKNNGEVTVTISMAKHKEADNKNPGWTQGMLSYKIKD